MKTPLLPPTLLMSLLALLQPVLADGKVDSANSLREHGPYGEAFRSFAVLAQEDDPAARFKLATLYYVAQEDVRAAIWFLITGAGPAEKQSQAVTA